jgi:alkanesulfonate monooxygenase SsuD/methylene tetrahydromethanopterin reductase-like flavin-dependent oxidoreductase (luciferase family)
MATAGVGTVPQFGISIVPAVAALDGIRSLARTADEATLDLVGIQDHPYQGRFLDTWSLIPMLLAETKRISVFTDVANLPLRPPAVMAKAAASLDVQSGGRFEPASAPAPFRSRSRAWVVRREPRVSRSKRSKRRST